MPLSMRPHMLRGFLDFLNKANWALSDLHNIYEWVELDKGVRAERLRQTPEGDPLDTKPVNLVLFGIVQEGPQKGCITIARPNWNSDGPLGRELGLKYDSQLLTIVRAMDAHGMGGTLRDENLVLTADLDQTLPVDSLLFATATLTVLTTRKKNETPYVLEVAEVKALFLDMTLPRFTNEMQSALTTNNFSGDRNYINRLPPELLSHIFTRIMPKANDWKAYLNVRSVLYSVNKHWHQVAYSTSRLWTSLLITPATSLSCVTSTLEHTGKWPLSIYLRLGWSDTRRTAKDVCADVLPFLVTNFARVQRLVIDCHLSDWDLIANQLGTADTVGLHRFSVIFHLPGRMLDDTPYHAIFPVPFQSYHHLRELNIERAPTAWTSTGAFARLVRLRLVNLGRPMRISWAELAEALDATTCLTVLEVVNVECSDIDSSQRVFLPGVTELTMEYQRVETVDAISLLDLPGLRSLNLRSYFAEALGYLVEKLKGLLGHAQYAQLLLVGCNSEDFDHLLGAMPDLIKLDITGCNFSLAQSTLKLLNVPSFDLPKLLEFKTSAALREAEVTEIINAGSASGRVVIARHTCEVRWPYKVWSLSNGVLQYRFAAFEGPNLLCVTPDTCIYAADRIVVHCNMREPTTFDTVTNLSNDLKGDGILALIFPTGHRTPISIALPIKTLASGERILDFDAYLYGTAAGTDTTDPVILPIRIDCSSPIFAGRSMKVVHLDQDHAGDHPENEAVAELLGAEYERWLGNIIVIGCDYIGNPERLSPDDDEWARAAVMCIIRDSREDIASEEGYEGILSLLIRLSDVNWILAVELLDTLEATRDALIHDSTTSGRSQCMEGTGEFHAIIFGSVRRHELRNGAHYLALGLPDWSNLGWNADYFWGYYDAQATVLEGWLRRLPECKVQQWFQSSMACTYIKALQNSGWLTPDGYIAIKATEYTVFSVPTEARVENTSQLNMETEFRAGTTVLVNAVFHSGRSATNAWSLEGINIQKVVAANMRRIHT
ncbi:hypothetical protein B0H11DRAFT_1908583 [Mycena galericulata]|nr:hypothetical protein B0H11DRAFT_1908583 [Mycena galericulata]